MEKVERIRNRNWTIGAVRYTSAGIEGRSLDEMRHDGFVLLHTEKGESFVTTDEDGNRHWSRVHETFAELELREDLLRGVRAYCMEKPTASQQRAIRPLLLGHDLIASMRSDTKVFAYCIDVLVPRAATDRSESNV
jgi:hypothetical protein